MTKGWVHTGYLEFIALLHWVIRNLETVSRTGIARRGPVRELRRAARWSELEPDVARQEPRVVTVLERVSRPEPAAEQFDGHEPGAVAEDHVELMAEIRVDAVDRRPDLADQPVDRSDRLAIPVE